MIFRQRILSGKRFLIFFGGTVSAVQSVDKLFQAVGFDISLEDRSFSLRLLESENSEHGLIRRVCFQPAWDGGKS